MDARMIAQSRQSLDKRLTALKPDGFGMPLRGWIRAIREALGMTSAQLARRMGVKQPTMVALEQSELKGTIQLASLRRAADAMNCTLVYALIPKGSLESIVHEQARKVARRRLRSVEHSMLLEEQNLPPADFEARLDALARELKPRSIWEEA